MVEIRRARELDPFSPALAVEHAVLLNTVRRFDAAEQEYRRILAQGQDTRIIRTLLAVALMGQGRDREGAAEAEAAAASDPLRKLGDGRPCDWCDAVIAAILAALGDPSPAEDLLAHLERDAAKRLRSGYESRLPP